MQQLIIILSLALTACATSFGPAIPPGTPPARANPAFVPVRQDICWGDCLKQKLAKDKLAKENAYRQEAEEAHKQAMEDNAAASKANIKNVEMPATVYDNQPIQAFQPDNEGVIDLSNRR